MLLCQIKLALWGGADVIMSAASTCFPVERKRKVTQSRFIRQVLINTGTYHSLCMHEEVVHNVVQS